METKRKSAKVVVSLMALAGLLLFSLFAVGGSLEPSAPPGPTMKTLAEVEPRIAVQSLPGDVNSLYVINESGSYYLTGNITGQAGKHGIKIDANNVTLDLMGFSLIGVPGSGHGVYDKASPKFMSIGNGTICNWGGNGIDCTETENPYHLQLEELSVHNNGGNGIDAYNGFLTIENVEASDNDANGINAYDMFLQIDGLSARNNTVHGLAVDGNSCCHMENVSFTYNGGDGMHILGMMTNVDAYSGYASHNGGHGVFVYGMLDAFGVLAPHNGGGGIIVNGSGNLNRCTVVGNGGSGIEAGTGSTVRNCTARGNTGDGIMVTSNCQVVGNTCESNGVGAIGTTEPAGIRATGSANRIEANHVIGNNVGIDIDAAGNLIIKNSASGNTTTNYEFADGNTKGPTIGTGDIASDNPHANYDL